MRKNAARIFLLGIVIVAVLMTVGIIDSSYKGYYSIKSLRKVERDIYESSTLIHTYEAADKYVDFVIDKDDNLSVIGISSLQAPFGKKYIISMRSSRPMSIVMKEDVETYKDSDILDFTWLPHLGDESLYYCLAPGDSVITGEGIETVAFSYKGEQLLLCLKSDAE